MPDARIQTAIDYKEQAIADTTFILNSLALGTQEMGRMSALKGHVQ